MVSAVDKVQHIQFLDNNSPCPQQIDMLIEYVNVWNGYHAMEHRVMELCKENQGLLTSHRFMYNYAVDSLRNKNAQMGEMRQQYKEEIRQARAGFEHALLNLKK